MAYISLVRSTLEYSAPIWDPYLKVDITKIEKIQRKAARFIQNDYKYTSSVTLMLKQLGWKDLETRRRDLRLALFFKVVKGLVAVKAEDIGLEPADQRTRSQHEFKYRIPKCNTNNMLYFLPARTIPIWNNLLADVVNSEKVDIFKEKLLKHFK